jgi:hypothetical protein
MIPVHKLKTLKLVKVLDVKPSDSEIMRMTGEKGILNFMIGTTMLLRKPFVFDI